MTDDQFSDVMEMLVGAFQLFRLDEPVGKAWRHGIDHVPYSDAMIVADTLIRVPPCDSTGRPRPPELHEFRRGFADLVRRREEERPARRDATGDEETLTAHGRTLARQALTDMRAMLDGSRRPDTRDDLIAYHLARQGPHPPSECYGGLCRSLGVDLSETRA